MTSVTCRTQTSTKSAVGRAPAPSSSVAILNAREPDGVDERLATGRLDRAHIDGNEENEKRNDTADERE